MEHSGTASQAGTVTVGTQELIPFPLYVMLLFIALTVPNIVFSGPAWFQTLHLLKWAVAFVPVAFMTIAAGINLTKNGAPKTGFVLDPFGAIWLFLLLFLSLQPLWAPLTSIPTFAREWFYFASLWAAYIVAMHLGGARMLKPLILAAALNALINIFFAELQIRGLNTQFAFILPTPGKYIGNTGQQNMLGLWTAMTMLGVAYLFLLEGLKHESRRDCAESVFNLFLLAGLSWGLWNTTSRSATLSFIAGWLVLIMVFSGQGHGGGKKALVKRNGAVLLLLAATLLGSLAFGRGGTFLSKSEEIVTRVETVGKRDSIWATSYTMFRMHPVTGVGLGHFKWNYLEAQKEMLQKWPEKEWKFTLWAHNEVLQWFCETGLPGGLVLVLFGVWWIKSFLKVLFRKMRIGPEASWACGMLFLLWVNAMWTRPFHRIENVLWMAFAFALANREMIPLRVGWNELRRDWIVRLLGVTMTVAALGGIVFLGGGMYGDRQLRVALDTRDAGFQLALLQSAERHLMVRDLAQRQIAYHYLARSRVSGNVEYLAEGLNRLNDYFRSHPQAREMNQLLSWYKRLDETELFESVAVYLHPRSRKNSLVSPGEGTRDVHP
ncbi:MAG: O-antigen ligase family protein [Thermovirgaceae bacterium]